MIINIHYYGIRGNETLSEIVARNLRNLGLKYPFLVRCDVTFKVDGHKRDNTKICEMHLSTPGSRLFTKSKQDDLGEAAAESFRELDRQLMARKDEFVKRKNLNGVQKPRHYQKGKNNSNTPRYEY